MNRIYEVEEGRPFWRMPPMQLIVTVTTVAAVRGRAGDPDRHRSCGRVRRQRHRGRRRPGRDLGLGEVAGARAGGDGDRRAALLRDPQRRLHPLPGDLGRRLRGDPGVARGLVGFAFYVANFSSYNKTYGSVAGVVVALLWLWITNVALLFGAELDAELERGRQLQLGIAAEETLQLPVRDTRGIEKAAARRAEELARCASIRLAAADPGDPADRPFGRS